MSRFWIIDKPAFWGYAGWSTSILLAHMAFSADGPQGWDVLLHVVFSWGVWAVILGLLEVGHWRGRARRINAPLRRRDDPAVDEEVGLASR